MMVAFRYDNDAVGSLFYSREVPSLLRGLRLSKLYGRGGIITFESNGLFVLARGNGLPRLIFPGSATSAATRPCIVTFCTPIRTGQPPRDEPRTGAWTISGSWTRFTRPSSRE